jgi:hypothetical protein
LISKKLSLQSSLGGPENCLSRVLSSETQGTLNQTEGSDAALFVGRARPRSKRRANPLATSEKLCDIGLLARSYGLLPRFRSELTGSDAQVRGDEFGLVVAVINTNELLIPSDLDVFEEQRRGHGIKSALHFDMGIRMDTSSPTLEEGEPLLGRGLKCQLIGFEKMGPDLLARRSMDSQSRDRAIPSTQELVLLVEAVESPALESVVLDVAAAALLLAVLLRIARSRRQRCETPVLSEREIRGVDVGVVQTSPHHPGLQVVMTDDLGHSLEVEERSLVQTEECLEFLIPGGFFVTVPRAAQRHPEHPRTPPLAALLIDSRCPAKEIDLGLFARFAVQYPDPLTLGLHNPRVPFHRLVAVGVTVLLDEIQTCLTLSLWFSILSSISSW